MLQSAEFLAFRQLSAALGSDPLRVQGPGGNTSIKKDGAMWIKASGTELADAATHDIFVGVDLKAARAEAYGDGDGSCKDTVLDPTLGLRPSIETTFHAAIEWPVIAHTHSIATLTHAISPEGRALARQKLAGLPAIFVPYAKPGLPLTREILARATAETQIVVLENHGLICGAASVTETEGLIEEVEHRLAMPDQRRQTAAPETAAPTGYSWAAESWIAQSKRAADLALGGSYYPDHVVFLGPALPDSTVDASRPAALIRDQGIAIRDGATASQKAMLRCLSDLLARLPSDWQIEAIGADAEAALLDWDAEKYRQALAARR
ncbi:MAG: class II aldolase/adducin family protein [Pseudomonadota bacterium]